MKQLWDRRSRRFASLTHGVSLKPQPEATRLRAHQLRGGFATRRRHRRLTPPLRQVVSRWACFVVCSRIVIQHLGHTSSSEKGMGLMGEKWMGLMAERKRMIGVEAWLESTSCSVIASSHSRRRHSASNRMKRRTVEVFWCISLLPSCCSSV